MCDSVSAQVNNQKAEAAIRRDLVLLETDPTSVSPQNAESPLPAFRHRIRDLVTNYMALYRNFAALSTWLTCFDQFATILPYLIVAPLLFADNPNEVVTLGKLVAITNAFEKVRESRTAATCRST